ncbi:hypothetical protein ACUWC1_30540, partial [Klebsiella pneumoniae]
MGEKARVLRKKIHSEYSDFWSSLSSSSSSRTNITASPMDWGLTLFRLTQVRSGKLILIIDSFVFVIIELV